MKHSTMMLPKFKRLARLLGGTVMAAGTLEVLWRTCDHIERFVFSPGEVEDICEWDGEPGRLVAILLDCRWLDQGEDGALVVHDYLENAPEFIRERSRKKEAYYRARAEKSGESRRSPEKSGETAEFSGPTDTDTDTEGSVKKADTDSATHDRRVGKQIGAAAGSVGRSVGVSSKLGGMEDGGPVAVGEVAAGIVGRVGRRTTPPTENTEGGAAGVRAAAGARSGGRSGVETGAGRSSLVGAVSGSGGRTQRRGAEDAEGRGGETGTKAQRAERLARQIVLVTGEPESYVEWWGKVVAQCLRPGHGVLSEVLTSKVQEGIEIRKGRAKLKDIPAMRNPGAVIAGAVRDAAKELGLEFRLPPKPAVRAARADARGVA